MYYTSLHLKSTMILVLRPMIEEPCNVSQYIRIPGLDGCIKIGVAPLKYGVAENICLLDGTHILSISTRKKSRALNRYLICNGKPILHFQINLELFSVLIFLFNDVLQVND